MVLAPMILTSRKGGNPYPFLRTGEKGVVITRNNRPFFSPPQVCQEIWDIRINGQEKNNLLDSQVGGRSLLTAGINVNNHVWEISKPLAEAIRAIASGSVVKEHILWDGISREFWKNTFSWVFGGGVVAKVGQKMMPIINSLLGEFFQASLAPAGRWPGILGTAEFLPISAFAYNKFSKITSFIGLDLGGASLKIAIVQVNNITGKVLNDFPCINLQIIERPSYIPFIWDTKPEQLLEKANILAKWLAETIIEEIRYASIGRIVLSPFIIIGFPFKINSQGKRLAGGTYPIPLGDFSVSINIESYIQCLLREALCDKSLPDGINLQDYRIIPCNDAVIAGAASITEMDKSRVAYVGIGSGTGGALFINPDSRENYSIL